MTTRSTWMMLLALVGPSCAERTSDEVPEGMEVLDPRRQLIRLSVDLRGVHPSEEELAVIEAHPEAYEAFVDRYLADPRFGDRMMELFNLSFRTRTGELMYDPEEAGLVGLDERRVAQSLADEPLELIRHVIENDLPYSEVVTADYTMADEVVARMWNLDYPEGATGWQQAHYVDGREHAGVLSMTTMWTRYPSAGVNGNRHRANTISRIFLCDDFLARPVSFSRTQIDALTSGDPEEVIRDTETCQSCHSSMDPLAAHFFGYWWEVEGTLADQTTYRPEDEPLWQMYAGKSPAYMGVPTGNVREMAERLAADDRFAACAVQTVFEGLTQRTVEDADWSEIATHRAVFDMSGMKVRELVRSIVTSPEYVAAKLEDEATAARIPTVKTVSPGQLSDIVAAKTGYRWTFDGWDALAHNDRGLAVLTGGIDSMYVVTPSHEPSVGLVFVQERLAQAAGWHVASYDLTPGREGDALMLAYVTVEDTPDTNADAFREQIRDLYLQVTGVPLPEDAPEPDALIALWEQLYSVDRSPVAAWAGVVSVVLRDPQVLFY